jgi:HK97 family phage prohead protease
MALVKSAAVEIKAAGEGLEPGQFEAFVSVMGNKDSYGDVVVPGAFDDTLAEWAASGNPIPVVWSHRYADVDNHIGIVLEAEQRTVAGKTGLWVKAQLDTEPDDRVALKVGRLMKAGRLTQFSFSYDVVEGAYVKSAELGDYYELRKLRLYEVGPTLIGANSETELLAAKALREIAGEIKAGRTLSAKNEDLLRTAHDSIGTVLDTLDSNDGKAMPDEPGGSPMRPGAAEKSALLSIELAALCDE